MNTSPRQPSGQRPSESGKLPVTEFYDLVEAQRSNIDAITKAHLIAVQGAHTIAKRQADVIRETFDVIADLAKDTLPNDDVRSSPLTDPKTMQAGFERALAHMKDLMDGMMETNMSVFDVMNSRIAELFDQSDK